MSSPWKVLATSQRAEQVALYGGSPGSVLQLAGSIQRAIVVESFAGPSLEDHTQAVRLGDSLISDGMTIWIEGFFPGTNLGEPVVQDRDEILATWDDLHAMLMNTSYELFLHYDAGSPSLYRKYRELTTVYVRTNWDDVLGMPYQFAATTSNHTLYDTAPGLPS